MIFSLAPMATLSHEGLRRLIHSFGDPDEYYAEMIQATSYLTGGRFESWYTRTAPDVSKIVWQLTCGTSEPLIEAAKQISTLGGAGIDINMGCCAPPILRQGAGFSWVTKEREETLSMLNKVKATLPNMRLSVKTRLGVSDKDPELMYENLLSFCKQLVDCGVELITIHPRTSKEKLKHLSKWQYVKRIAKDLPIKIIGNGDIHSASEAIKKVNDNNLSGAMIGRQAVTYPWIFAQINKLKENCPDEFEVNLEDTGLLFLEYLQESQPPEFYTSRAHRFFFYFCDNLKFAHYLKMKIQNVETLTEIEKIWKEYFLENPTEKIKITKN